MPSKRCQQGTVTSDGELLCTCGEPTVGYVTKKEGTNHGRVFHKCARPQSENPCKFFAWMSDAESCGAIFDEGWLPSNDEDGEIAKPYSRMGGKGGQRLGAGTPLRQSSPDWEEFDMGDEEASDEQSSRSKKRKAGTLKTPTKKAPTAPISPQKSARRRLLSPSVSPEPQLVVQGPVQEIKTLKKTIARMDADNQDLREELQYWSQTCKDQAKEIKHLKKRT